MIFKPSQVIVHHDGVSRKGPSFDIVNQYHETQRFPKSSLGFFVGYHFWIERNGLLRQARSETEIGAHAQGQNYTALGIGLAGNFDKEMPTKEQIATLGQLLSRLCFTYSIPHDRIFPHRHYASKTCYGSLLDATWAQGVFLQYEQARIATTLAELGIGVVASTKKKALGFLENLKVKVGLV